MYINLHLTFLSIIQSKNLFKFKFHSQKIAEEAKHIFFGDIPKTFEYQTLEHTTIAEEYIFQMPIQGTSISVMQPAMADQITPIIHTVSAGQTDCFAQNIDGSTPLYIFTPVTPVTIQIPMNENTLPTTLVEIPVQNEITTDVSNITLVDYFSSFEQKLGH